MSLDFIKETPRETLVAIFAELGVMQYEILGVQKRLASDDAKLVLTHVSARLEATEELIRKVISGLDLTGWEELK